MPISVTELPGPEERPVRIRPARIEDAEAILAFLAEVGAETGFLSFGAEGSGLTPDAEREYLQRTGQSDNGIALIAEWEGRIVGLLTFNGSDRKHTRHAGELGISIARFCWGRGIGRTLIQLLLRWAESGSAVRKINLRVRADNVRAIALYESLGFVTEGRLARDNLVDGVFHDSLVMGRLVDPLS